MSFIKRNWFLLGLLGALVLAFIFPWLGRVLNPEKTTATAAVVIIFFLSGLSLSSEAVLHGIRQVKLHIFIQTFCFVLIPLYFLLTALPLRGLFDSRILIGVYALACLPITISTSVVFTQIAGGNTAGAVFNSSLANLAGIVISPLLLTSLVRQAGLALPMEEVIRILRDLALMILLPFGVGQVCHWVLPALAAGRKKMFSNVSSVLVLLIVFFAFSSAVSNGTLHALSKPILALFAYLAFSNIVFMIAAFWGAKFIGLNHENRIAALFCAPQKTLAMGVPLLTTYFSDRPELLGMALIPVLLYHPWQILTAGLARDSKWVKNV